MILNVLIILRNNKLSIHKKKRYAKCNERLMKLKPKDTLDYVNIVGKEIHGTARIEELEVIDIEFTQEVDVEKSSSNSRAKTL